MKQAIIRKGEVFSEELPKPFESDNTVLIEVMYSSISTGTEISSIISSKKGLIKSALEKPEKVIKYLNKIKTSGISKVLKEIKEFNEMGIPTGYSVAGRILAVGKNIKNFSIGEFVAAAGGGYAFHAEFVEVPENLVVKIPQDMNLSYASTVAIGSIALHGVRRAAMQLGEFVVVYGVGLIGLITVQILNRAGIRVIAIDLENKKLDLAKEYGAELTINNNQENVIEKVKSYTGGKGTDAVIFTAATSDSLPLSNSFKMTRKKGKVVLVGVAGLNINREDMYENEIDFIISTSYGPGRYDKEYEEKGKDYPYAYVRWTENRNMVEYCRLVYNNIINLEKLISKIFPIEKVTEAFNFINNTAPKPLLVLLEYSKEKNSLDIKSFSHNFIKSNKLVINVAIIGVGSFAQNIHIPNLLKLKDKFKIRSLVDKKGFEVKELAEKYNVKNYFTDANEVFNDPEVDLVMICTRHNNHGELVIKGLNSNKNVFVEKPLCTSFEELEQIKNFYSSNSNISLPILMVGYNRRFSKYARELKSIVENRINPMIIYYRMNSGFIPLDSWIHDDGGRLVGEACHIVDLMNYFTGAQIHSIFCEKLTPKTNYYSSDDNASITLKYKDGSVCVINYFANGSNELNKEYMEIHFDNKSLILDDYKVSYGYGVKLSGLTSQKSDKGHYNELLEVYNAIQGSKFPIELWDLFQTSEITLNLKNA